MTHPKRLFDLPTQPRSAPRKLMHVIDAGEGIEDRDRVKFKCKRFGHESAWMLMLMWEAKRGIPCPKCNQ